MRAISYREIDGIRVVVDIVDPTIDPEATLERARIEVAAAGYQDRFDELTARYRALDSDDVDGVVALKKEVARYALEQSLAIREQAASNPIYFAHVHNEILTTDEKAEQLKHKIKSLEKNERLTVDGAVIQDNRGRTHYRRDGARWVAQKVKNIGEVKSSSCTWKEDLDEHEIAEIEEQTDREKIDKMTPAERRAKSQLEIEMSAKDCANLRSVLEIKGDNNALTKARAQFEQLKADILKRYKLDGGSNGGQIRAPGSHDPIEQTDRSDRSRDTGKSD